MTVNSSYYWRQMGLPGRTWGIRLGDLDEPFQELIDLHLDWPNRHIPQDTPLHQFPSDRSRLGRGVMLSGEPGRGKTTQACAALVSICRKYQVDGHFIRFSDYVQSKTKSFTLHNKVDKGLGGEAAIAETERFAELETRLYTVPLLVLDDVGKEHRTASGYAAQQVTTLLRHRHDAMLPTIITTNLRGGEWAAVYDESTASFAMEAFDIVYVSGPDYRAAST
ncbi:ATP-binding protein [Streptomyces sp. NRRL F-4489]|uniref:ATP-binding protein n=1 Tax=Streptomyces sp. NRRL F-4489 TaxID=1609095 RepID=UPI000B0B10CD|nr:ATP-binding protein [Streptomyces sp. NRRL F-4489]